MNTELKISRTDQVRIVKNRLKEILNSRGIEKPTNEVLKTWGATPRVFNRWLSNTSNPSVEQAAIMAQDLGVRLDQMFRTENLHRPRVNKDRLKAKYA